MKGKKLAWRAGGEAERFVAGKDSVEVSEQHWPWGSRAILTEWLGFFMVQSPPVLERFLV